MKKTFLFYTIVSLLAFITANAQSNFKVEFKAGLIAPINAKVGISEIIQLNYRLTSDISLYSNIGFSYWDHYKSTIQTTRGQQTIPTQNEHKLFSFFLGSRLYFLSIGELKSFADVEMGYSYFDYISYEIAKENYPDYPYEVYFIEENSGIGHYENLFVLGTGLGISQKITGNMDIVLIFKLNSFLRSNYTGLLGNKNTYSTTMLGLSFNL